MAKLRATININVSRIDKSAIHEGKSGKYVNFALFENDEPDQYGNDGFVVQDLPKERRDAGERGPIVGNWKWKANKGHQNAPESRGGSQTAPRHAERQNALYGAGNEESDDIPF